MNEIFTRLNKIAKKKEANFSIEFELLGWRKVLKLLSELFF